MKKTKKILFLATVCTAVLFAMCTKSDDADVTPNEVVAAGAASCDHPVCVQHICPAGLYFDPSIEACVPLDELPGPGPWSTTFSQCIVCGDLMPGTVLRSSLNQPVAGKLYDCTLPAMRLNMNSLGAMSSNRYSELTVILDGRVIPFMADTPYPWTHEFMVTGLNFPAQTEILIGLQADAIAGIVEFNPSF